MIRLRPPAGVVVLLASRFLPNTTRVGSRVEGLVVTDERGTAARGEGSCTALEATQGQIDGGFSQLPYKCYLEEVASVGD